MLNPIGSGADRAAPILLVAAAAALDRLVGDPRWSPHPVVLMGWWISRLRRVAEAWAGDRPWPLRLAGVAITLLLVLASGLVGWIVERLSGFMGALGVPLLLLALASALAGRSLEQAVEQVLDALARNQLPLARQRLAWIVGRDTEGLDAAEILRASAETASENAVDGLFAPLFWMLVGAGLWLIPASAPWCTGAAETLQRPWSELHGLPFQAAFPIGPGLPGPLALAWMFKAASTLDSMLGYRRGRLRWLGTAGARLDDALTWLPCRLVALSLPLAAGRGSATWRLFRRALREGADDPSPNAGVSQAIYAVTLAVRLGGLNHYAGEARRKPLLAAECGPADLTAVRQILRLNRRLERVWLVVALALVLALPALRIC